MSNSDPIAYTYEADTHCPRCTEDRFGRGPDGFIAEYPTEDSEGNPVGAVFTWSEWAEPSEAASFLTCGTCGEEIARSVDDDAVRAIGEDAGKAAATWVEVEGPTNAAEILNGYEDGDPEVMDWAPAPLSGEWAGDSIPEMSDRFGLPLEDDEVDELFEAGFSDGYWAEVQRVCRDILTGSTYFERFDIAEAFSVWCAEWADASDPYWVAKSAQLRRIGFGPRPNLSRSTLTANSLGILLRLEAGDRA